MGNPHHKKIEQSCTTVSHLHEVLTAHPSHNRQHIQAQMRFLLCLFLWGCPDTRKTPTFVMYHLGEIYDIYILYIFCPYFLPQTKRGTVFALFYVCTLLLNIILPQNRREIKRIVRQKTLPKQNYIRKYVNYIFIFVNLCDIINCKTV